MELCRSQFVSDENEVPRDSADPLFSLSAVDVLDRMLLCGRMFVPCRVFSSLPGQNHPPGRDNQKCLQTFVTRPRDGAASSLAENTNLAPTFPPRGGCKRRPTSRQSVRYALRFLCSVYSRLSC